MAASAALAGDYVDLKFVKGRGVAVILVEIPIEQAPDFVKAFGTPMPGTGVPVAMARLATKGQRQAEEPVKVPRRMGELPLPQQAALLCDREAFWNYLRERTSWTIRGKEDAAAALRGICGVTTRGDIAPDTPAGATFFKLKGEFDVWMAAA